MCPSRESNQAPLVGGSIETMPRGAGGSRSAAGAMYTRAFVLPLLIFVAVPIVCLVTYTVSVLNDHVAPDFPYISETGSLPPESCIFSQALNVASFLMLFIVYVKYRQVWAFSALRRDKGLSMRSNGVAAWFGVASCVGLNVVANFQEANVLVVHLMGAGVCFVAGTVYFCMQTTFSRKMSPEVNSSVTVYLRMTLSLLCVVFTVTTVVPAIISVKQFDGADRKHWGPEDGGYAAHLVSTVSEWLLVLAYISFILSTAKELSQVHLRAPEVILLNVEAVVEQEGGHVNVISKEV